MILTGVLEMTRTAYSLIRWSSPKQREGHSKKRQEAFAPRWCRENGVRLDDSMDMILDGQSAFRGHHRKQGSRKYRALAAFMEAIRTGQVAKGSILIVENLDRLSREEIDSAYQFIREILAAGIDIVQEFPFRWYTKASLNNHNQMSEILNNLHRAHEESLMKSKRLREVWGEKKRLAAETGEPVSHNCPAWIELGADGKYHLIPERAETVKSIFQMAIDGLGVSRIVGALNKSLIACFGRKGKWTEGYVLKILRRQATFGGYEQGTRDPQTGKWKPTGEVVRDYYPPVISEAEWQQAQRAIKGRYRSSGQPGKNVANLFTGKLFDVESREAMQERAVKYKKKTYKYLVTPRAEKLKRVPYEPVEAAVVRTLGELKAEDVLPPGQEADAKLSRIKELTNDDQALCERLTTLESQQNDPKTPPELLPSIQRGIVQVIRQRKENAKELRELEEEVNTNRTKSLGACQSALALLDTPERRQTAKGRIHQLVDSIWIFVQPVSRTRRIIHVQIYLRGGRKVYRQILPPNPPTGLRPWPLRDCDFRSGNVGDIARQAESA